MRDPCSTNGVVLLLNLSLRVTALYCVLYFSVKCNVHYASAVIVG